MAKQQQRNSKAIRSARPEDRVSQIVQQWFLTEPLLFGAWTTHQVESNQRLQTIRCGRGKIEYNPTFIRSLDTASLQEVLKVEALRIILKHPYERRKPNATHAMAASSLAIRESIRTSLPIPTAQTTFGSTDHDRKYFEYYYNLLCEVKDANDSESGDDGDGACDGESGECDNENEGDGDCDCEGCRSGGKCKGSGNGSGKGQANGKGEFGKVASADSGASQGDALALHCDPSEVGIINAALWDEDPFFCEQINDLISETESNNSWGTIPGGSREQILATLKPRLDYRQVLRQFRATILSSDRRLTRMKPSRRYGFLYMGSRRDFTTNLLFAVDVSGSIGTQDMRNAFSIVNRLFKYGIESIDVIWFDTEIRTDKPLTMKRARAETAVDGRGGTNFQPLMHYLDEHRQYDGMIVFTDGIAPVPEPPKKNRRTRVVWLFNYEENWEERHRDLELRGMASAFVRPS